MFLAAASQKKIKNEEKIENMLNIFRQSKVIKKLSDTM